MKLPELKELAKQMGLRGTSTMRKPVKQGMFGIFEVLPDLMLATASMAVAMEWSMLL